LDDLARLALHFTDLDHILGGHPVLLAARFKDREHLPSSSKPCYFQAPSKPDARGVARTGFFQSILLTVRGLGRRDGGIECADRRGYVRHVSPCQEMQPEAAR